MKANYNELKCESSFLSCEKDTQLILKRLLFDCGEYSDKLKKLLIVNTKDCLEPNPIYDNAIKDYSIKKLIDEEYIKLSPRIEVPEHEEVKAYMIISYDGFVPTSNPQYRDNTISFDIICNNKYWELDDCALRPIKIMGYIDGLLNNCRLTGIGTLQFMGAQELIINNVWAGYTLQYIATHGHDDKLESNDN